MSDKPKVREGHLYTNGKTAVHAYEVEIKPMSDFSLAYDIHYVQVNRAKAECFIVDEEVFLKRYPYRVKKIVIEVGDE